MTDDELYRRGLDTAVACWTRFARSVRGAVVHRLRHVDVAVFPTAPENGVYNNAVVAPGIAADACGPAVGAVEDLYTAGGVTDYAVWVHENDDDARDTLERRGYHIATSTRAMGMQRAEFRDAPGSIELVAAGWLEHKRIVGVDPALLHLLDAGDFELLVAADRGEPVATGIAFDHEGDRGIYNVATIERARRRGIGTALTAKLVRDAWQRGCETVTLQSTPVAERVYASLGFRDLGRIVEYSR